MYIVQSIWGNIKVFDNLAAAEEAYFDEVALSGCAELRNAYTGETIRTSY